MSGQPLPPSHHENQTHFSKGIQGEKTHLGSLGPRTQCTPASLWLCSRSFWGAEAHGWGRGGGGWAEGLLPAQVCSRSQRVPPSVWPRHQRGPGLVGPRASQHSGSLTASQGGLDLLGPKSTPGAGRLPCWWDPPQTAGSRVWYLHSQPSSVPQTVTGENDWTQCPQEGRARGSVSDRLGEQSWLVATQVRGRGSGERVALLGAAALCISVPRCEIVKGEKMWALPPAKKWQ